MPIAFCCLIAKGAARSRGLRLALNNSFESSKLIYSLPFVRPEGLSTLICPLPRGRLPSGQDKVCHRRALRTSLVRKSICFTARLILSRSLPVPARLAFVAHPRLVVSKSKQVLCKRTVVPSRSAQRKEARAPLRVSQVYL